jgi:hypothetical protein
MVAETKDVKALRFDHRGACGIALLGFIGEMLSAVELDDEVRCVTDEVGDIIFDRDLAPKADTKEAMIA